MVQASLLQHSPVNSSCFGLPVLSALSLTLRECITFCLDSLLTSLPKTLASSKLGNTWASPNLFPISQGSFLYYPISDILKSVFFPPSYIFSNLFLVVSVRRVNPILVSLSCLELEKLPYLTLIFHGAFPSKIILFSM